MPAAEHHRSHRIGWLRAAVLGANDGIISTASLMIGMATANTASSTVLLSGIAALVAGAMSMAAGEYVSVSSQADTEQADLDLEKNSLKQNPSTELAELIDIYQARGLTQDLAQTVAEQLTAHNALEAHARDELGITDTMSAKPFQAAWTSALTFSAGSMLPILAAWITPSSQRIPTIAISSLVMLACLGALAAYAGGAKLLKGAFRVTALGALAMCITALVGHWFELAS